MAYSAITNAEIDTDSPLTTALMTKYRDNPEAIAQGLTGATRIVRGAFAGTSLLQWLYDYGDGSDGALTWTTAGSSYAAGLYQATTFTVAVGETATMSGVGTTMIIATTSITINGTLNADGRGGQGGESGTSTNYPPGAGGAGVYGGGGGGGTGDGNFGGGGGGPTAYTSGGAASLSGAGGAGTAQTARTQSTLKLLTSGVINTCPTPGDTGANAGYDQGRVRQSSTGGGGGGGSNYGAGTLAGNGGGLVVLVAPLITIGSGAFIYARGTNAGSTAGGGGGGGCVLLATPSGGLSNSGTITVTGGTGSSGGNGAAGWWSAVTI